MSARFESIAEKYLEPVIRGPVEYMTACPFCQGSSSLQFNIDTGLWVCFKCDSKGNAKGLVKRLGGVYADPIVGTEAIHRMLDRYRTNQKKREQPQKVYPESYLSRFDFSDSYWTDIRGFDEATIQKWNLGYDPISDRNTIAFRNHEGELLGVIQRLKGADVIPRYIYPEGFDRKNSLFGSWEITEPKAALVEGSTDVIAASQAQVPGVGQYGSSISLGQARLLHRIGLREVVLFYDYDEAGRKAEERSREVLRGLILRKVVWDQNKYCWHKKLCGCGEHTWRNIGKCEKRLLCRCGRKHEMDPGSLTTKEIRKMYRNAVLIGRKKR